MISLPDVEVTTGLGGYEGKSRFAYMYIQMYIIGMTKRYSIADARAKLPAIVNQAEAGQEIELTRRGKPVAILLSLQELARLRGAHVRFADAYQKFIAGHRLKEVGLEKGYFDSFRDRSIGRKVDLD